ncbi:galactose oxidase [Hymenobacter sp. BRD128]|uniref:Kelch repeat-containing protein n=1 Tax=Hymenobacter sp. BRD128 TaxID=2675878 RepID=UPI0015636756|nr:kelch repeat-containing protein [Hymenobacter sp. BRD128]QKG55871.1 galactose oxidase [Hymenobacter sp. BRD128]
MKNFPRLAGRMLALLLVLGGLGLSSCHKDTTTTVYGNWQKGNSFPGTIRSNAVSFVVNGVAYVGTGIDGNSVKYNDFYSFNPATGSWLRLTPFPGVARYNATAFSVGSFGYVGTGYDGTNYLKDMWKFDPSQNTTTTTGTTTVTTVGKWTQIADLPVSPGTAGRYGAVAGSVGNYGYVGCGFDGNNEKDFYRYDPTANTWSTFAGFPGDKRINAVAFTINNVLYVGTGINNGQYTTDFYAYDPAKDAWTTKSQLANISNSTASYDYSKVARSQAVAFTVGNYGYVTTGSNGAVTTSCYQYDPTQDIWTAMNPFLGTGRNAAVGFGIGSFGYVGTGNSGSNRLDDFWTFDPNVTQQ